MPFRPSSSGWHPWEASKEQRQRARNRVLGALRRQCAGLQWGTRLGNSLSQRHGHSLEELRKPASPGHLSRLTQGLHLASTWHLSASPGLVR